MKKKNVFSKVILLIFAVLLVISLLAPAIFSQRAELREPRQEKLLNGLKVLMWSDPRAEKVSLRLRIHSGSAFDPQGKEGVMKMLAENIFPNTHAMEFFADELGGSLEIVSGYDYIQINATSKPDQFLQMFETVANAVSNVTIDKETTAKLKADRAAELKRLEADPEYLADASAAKLLFGTFPYGRPVTGTTESVSKIEFADLIDARQRFLTSDNATLAISGNFDSNLAYRAARRYFGSWVKADKKVPSTFRQPDLPDPTIKTIVLDGTGSSEVRYAVRGVARNDPAYAASQILAEVLRSRLAGTARNDTARGYVNADGHLLPGSIIFGLSGESLPGPPSRNASEVVAQLLAAKISDTEFRAAAAAVNARSGSGDPIDTWLDIDTFKTPQPPATAVPSVADVQLLADRIKAGPAVGIVVNRGAQTNSVPK
jgi:zinc protease